MAKKRLSLTLGESRLVSREWAQEVERADTSISSSAWEYDGSATLTGASTSGTAVTVLFTPTTSGTLRNEVTFADGQIFAYEWSVSV